MKSIYCCLILICLTISCTQSTTKKEGDATSRELIPDHDANPVLTEAQIIAAKNGLGEWEKVSQIDFTFNVDRGGNTVAQRSWSWKPKTGDVTMTSGENTASYNRNKIDSTSIQADQGFINDKFWLLAPYQLVWDEGTKITTQDTATAPMSQRKTKKLTIIYGDEGGYTPGDAYDFYYDEDYIIDEWVFRKGNSDTASMTTTFEAYQDHAGLNIATSHKGMGSDFRLYFTNIKVQQ